MNLALQGEKVIENNPILKADPQETRRNIDPKEELTDPCLQNDEVGDQFQDPDRVDQEALKSLLIQKTDLSPPTPKGIARAKAKIRPMTKISTEILRRKMRFHKMKWQERKLTLLPLRSCSRLRIRGRLCRIQMLFNEIPRGICVKIINSKF